MLTSTPDELASRAPSEDLPVEHERQPWWRGPMGYRLPLELLLCASLFYLYRYGRYLARNEGHEAFSNARHVMRIEQMVGIFNEAQLQDLFLNSRGLIELLNRYYVVVHWSATVVFLVWAYVRHHDLYVKIRNLFIVVTGAALAIHILVPLAPPRMFPSSGFVDTLRLYGPRIYTTDVSASVANQFAAVPSLHFGWAVLVAGGVVAIKRSRRSLVMLLHPIVTLIAIVATANHYWTDALVALALILLAVAIQRLWWARRTIWARGTLAVRYLTTARL